jgi:hypothetical protein
MKERGLPEPKSVRDQKPLETGGTVARKGFIYQDHVACGFCLVLALDPNLKEVWCETQDDITLIWACGQAESVEFVQVKSNELEKLWSVAELCKREGPAIAKRPGTSILEKSLANDRNKEASLFRIVTLRSVNNDLKALTYPKDSPARTQGANGLDIVHAQVEERLPKCCSPKNNGSEYWLRNMLWEVKESEGAVKNSNLIALRTFAETIGSLLVTDQLEELYQQLLRKAQDAACADWKVDPGRKKFIKKAFCDWLKKTIENIMHPAALRTGKKMREKMEAAGLPADYIRSAHAARRAYRKFLLHPAYQKTADLSLIESEVVSKLHQLRSQLDAGVISDPGIQFHARCLSALEEIRSKSASEIPLFFFQGCMYSITDRCLHRFTAASI